MGNHMEVFGTDKEGNAISFHVSDPEIFSKEVEIIVEKIIEVRMTSMGLDITSAGQLQEIQKDHAFLRELRRGSADRKKVLQKVIISIALTGVAGWIWLAVQYFLKHGGF